MFGRFFKRQPGRALKAAPSTPGDTVVWAVGDVHGRLDLLKPLTDRIMDDLARSRARRKVLVFLGDYVDRGPDSKGVLDLLCALQSAEDVETHFLRGNHEDRMEGFLDDPTLGPRWCDFGGREALHAYGVAAPMFKDDILGWSDASVELNAAMSAEHRAFLRNQAYSVSIGDYFFSHAGAEPGVPLHQQDSHQLMWVREPFLLHPDPFEQVVVHGHTPAEAVYADHRRIGLDTGAYATGVLTGLRLEGAKREVLQTSGGGDTVTLQRQAL